MASSRPSVLAVVVALSAAVAVPARAQVNDKALAESLFQEGRDLLKRGQTAQACARFEKSQQLEARLGTLLNVATCHEELGRTASAWGEFVQATELAKHDKDDKRGAFAREHARALEPTLSKLELSRAGDEKDFTLVIDGRAVNAVLLGTPLPLDPGKHVLQAKAAGRKSWTTEFTLPRGPARTPLRIPALEPGAEPTPPIAPPGIAAPPPAIAPRDDPSKARGGGGWPRLAYVGVGVGAAGVLLGGVTGGISIAQTSSISGGCRDGVCAGDAGRLSTANTFANVSNVAFAVAGAGVVVAAIALITAPSKRTGRAVRLGPARATPSGLAFQF